MKYIIDKWYGPVVFGKGFEHKEVAQKLGLESIESAGFVMELCGKLQCFGDSMTLNVKSREGDGEILMERLRD